MLCRWFHLCLVVLAPVAGRGAALSWEAIEGGRRAPLVVEATGRAGFVRLTNERAGIRFTNALSTARSILNRSLLNGSGVAAGDFDGDGWCDLYFCGLDSDNVLYRNLGGWRFEDATARAGVACAGQDSSGAVFADVDGDGDPDLLVSGLGFGARLFLNQGDGRFEEVTDAAGLRSAAGSTSLALADVDGDGDLDLYLANHRKDTISDQPTTRFRIQRIDGKPVVIEVNGQPVTLPQWTNRFEVEAGGNVTELGEPDQFYLNDGRGVFTRVAFTGGWFLDEDGRPLRETPADWGLAAQFHDVNGDGAPDLYVCNDFASPDRFWINDGTGRFRAIGRTALRTISTFSMGVDFADINRDGAVDVFVVDMLSPDHRRRHVQVAERAPFRWPPGILDNRPQAGRNTLQLNRGDGTFAEVALFAGVEASDWSWGPVFLDVDLDGYEDLLVSNGVLRDFQNMDMTERIQRQRAGQRLTQNDILQLMAHFPSLATPNVAWRNRGDGTFEVKSAEWGFDLAAISQGVALADLDNDGDLDVIVNNLPDAPAIYQNVGDRPRVAVRLKGAGGNTAGIGARIRLRGGGVEQSQEMISGGRYLSGDQSQRVFAAGSADKPLEIEVTWRSGRRSVLPARANHVYEITEPSSVAAPPAPAAAPGVRWFEEAADVALPPHIDPMFDDFLRQPLLTRALSQMGPGVAWHDLDGDGWDELVMGSGREGRLAVMRNLEGGGFAPLTNAALNRPVPRDQTGIVGIGSTLIIGSSNYEDGATNAGLVRIHDFQRGVAGESALGLDLSAGPVSAADVDGDGDLDLFIGGRVVPGRYPEAAASVLLINEGGRFAPAQRWDRLGLVNGSAFSDLDQDGIPELILATEWGPVRVFQRVNGRFEERTAEWGLAEHTGLWRGVATGDFDGDGRPEIVASNWGLNTHVRASRAHPRRVHFGDLDGNGTFEVLESRFVPELGKPAPDMTFDLLRAAMPVLQGRIPSFEAYSGMSLEEILGDFLPRASSLEMNTLESTRFVWKGGQYEARALPREAQLAPAFGLAVADLDGDGTEDLFVSQNFFAVGPFEPRCDAGRGLLLKGDGRGGLAAVPGQESGLEIYGEQRGCAAGDFDGDGRVDLAVTQNGNVPKLYRNRAARPGLRVRLAGPPGNPAAVGATLRWSVGGRMGPAREIQSGSGYWSQNSMVQVLSLPVDATSPQLWVRWPGGGETRSPVPPGAREVEITPDGRLVARR